MVVMSKAEARRRFADRLNLALDGIAEVPRQRGRIAWVGKAFKVSSEMARKWLQGEAMPNQARLPGIALALQVAPAWLRDGVGPQKLSTDELWPELEKLWHRMSLPMRLEVLGFATFKLGGALPPTLVSDSKRSASSRTPTY